MLGIMRDLVDRKLAKIKVKSAELLHRFMKN